MLASCPRSRRQTVSSVIFWHLGPFRTNISRCCCCRVPNKVKESECARKCSLRALGAAANKRYLVSYFSVLALSCEDLRMLLLKCSLRALGAAANKRYLVSYFSVLALSCDDLRMLLLSRTFVGVCAGKHVQATFCAIVILHRVIASRLISCHRYFTVCKPLLSFFICVLPGGGVWVCHGSLTFLFVTGLLSVVVCLVLPITSGAWPFVVGGVICLVTFAPEGDLNLLNGDM